MAHTPLAIYLRSYRLRTGLSHEDVAFLLGSISGANVSKHELGRRLPALRNALAYELVLGVPMRVVYEELFFEVRGEICRRARGLCRSYERRRSTSKHQHRIRVLNQLIKDHGEVTA
jgi:transcriptional regulator with XRE-family HTH domain